MCFISHITFLFLISLLHSFRHFASANTALSWPDLNSDSLTDFTTQASNWAISTGATPSSAISTACTLFPALGGPGVFTSSTGSFERTYYLLESHVSVFITAEITFIDNWANGDILTVTVGTSSPLDFTFGSASNGFFTSNQCGTSQNDFPSVIIEIMTANSDTNLTLQFSKTTSLSTSQFAIRNINIALSSQTVSTVSPSGSAQLCFFTTNTGFSSNACACPLNQYESSTSPVTCSDCHFTCETCYGASSTNCLTCKSGLSFTGSACVVCDTSCATCFGTGSTQCSSCYNGYYLYSDSVCRDYCATGYSRTTGGINYCDDPLTTCTTNCTNTTNTTNTTTSTEETSLCSDLNTANYDQVSSGILYYYPDDSTCKTTCLTPYTTDGDGQVRYCNLSLSEEDQNTISALNSAANSASAVLTAGVAVMSATNPADPNGISVGTLAKMFEYTRYINVTRSAKLEAFYKNKRSSPGTVSIGPAMPQESIALFTSRELPNIFDKQNVNSNFLVEFFRNLETLLIISAAIILLIALKNVVRRNLRALIQTHNQLTVAVLAFLIMQFYNVYTDILFMSTIQFMSFEGGNGLDWLSFFFAIAFLALAVAILVFHFRILWKYQKLKSKSKPEYIHEVMLEFQKKHEKTEVLYRDFKDITFVQQGYLFLLTFRAAVTGIVMSAFYNFPGVQVGYNIAMNTLAICYLLISFPFKNTPSVYQQMAYEVNLLFVNICLCFMVLLDATESQADNLRTQLGDAIIIAIFVSKFVVIITIVPKIIEALPSALKIYRDSINRLRRVRKLSSKPIRVENSRSPTIQDEDRPIMLEAITFEGSQRKQTEDNLKTETAKITFEKDEILSPATRSDTIKQSVLSRTCVAEKDDEVGTEGMRPVMKFQIRDTIMK